MTKEKISLCPNCNCMTHTIKGNCGKCGALKLVNSVNGGTCYKCGEKNCEIVGFNIHKCKVNQNNDREEFDWKKEFFENMEVLKINDANSSVLWSWIQSYTQKKVEEQRTELLEEILGEIDKLSMPVGRRELEELIKKL